MKRLLVLLSLILSLPTFSFQFNIENMNSSSIEGIFDLSTNVPNASVSLDCMSFLQGFIFYEINDQGNKEQVEIFLLPESECHKIYSKVNSILEDGQKICIQLDLINNSYQLSQNIKNCSYENAFF